jgi:4-amino-4-deoxy-L-arabinose transferase-like glycosyltransferase
VGYGLALLDRGPQFDGQDHPYAIAAVLVLPTWLALPGPDRYSQGDVDRPDVLFPARRMNLLLATIGLGLLAAFARKRRGEGFALVVLAIGALDPSWLAQARYATTDVGHGLAWWLAAGGMLLHQQEGKRRWLIVAALGMAVGLASKWSTLALPLLVPLLWLSVDDQPWRARLVAIARAAGVTGVLALLLLLLPILLLGRLHDVPLPDAIAHVWNGVQASLVKRAGASGVYLLGTWWPEGTRWYFPLLLLAKTPVALLVAAGVGALWRPARAMLRADRGALLFLLGYLALAIAAKQNLGHRHLTPFLPVLWWLAAAAALTAWQEADRLRWTAPALAGLFALEALAIHPNYLAFTNGAFGGVDAVPPVVVNAGADWGQALPALRSYLQAHPASRVDLAYFGNAEPRHYVGETVWRSCGILGRPPAQGQVRAAIGDPTPLLAVSTTCVYGGAGVRAGRSIDLTRRDDAWAYLRGKEPDAVVGGSILIFRDQPGENTNGH